MRLRHFIQVGLDALMWPFRALSRLTREGGLFATLTLVCGLLSVGATRWSNIALLMSLVMLSMWVLALWQGTWSLRGIEIKRTHVERVFANEPVAVILQVTNDSHLPAAGLLITESLEPDEPPRAIPAANTGGAAVRETPERVTPVSRGSTFVTVLPGKGSSRPKYSLVLRRRGLYRFGESRIETFLPFWFFHSSATRRVAGRLIVYPRLGDVDTSFFDELDVTLQYLRRTRPSRAEEDFRGLREYTRGDNAKWIHWKSSARVQKLLVKEFEEPQARRVLIMLDTNLQRMGIQRFPAFELAISFAASVTRELLRRGCEVECAALQPQKRLLHLSVSRERRNLDALLESLAGLKRDDTRTLSDLIEPLGRRSLHHVCVLVIGLGSLRAKVSLSWLNTGDNAVKLVDIRSAEFRRLFNLNTAGLSREEAGDEELLPGMNEEETVEENLALA